MKDEIMDELGEILDSVAGDDYEGWGDYWADRNAQRDGLWGIIMDWMEMCKERMMP